MKYKIEKIKLLNNEESDEELDDEENEKDFVEISFVDLIKLKNHPFADELINYITYGYIYFNKN